MNPIEQAYQEVCRIHEQLTRAPVPEISPQSFVPFPPGIDPVAYTLEEVAHLKQLVAPGTTSAQRAPARVCWVPRVNVFAADARMMFQVEIPGVDREDVKVSVLHGELIVRGERRATTDASLQPLVMEQSDGSFERRFALPVWADTRNVTASYRLGLLEITVQRDKNGADGEVAVAIA